MSKKPSLIDKSTEELLNEISMEDVDSNEESLLEEFSAGFLFLRNYQIRTGDIQIKRTLLYELYKRSQMQPVSGPVFYKDIENYLKNDTKFYYINKELSGLVELLTSSIKKTKSKKLSVTQHDLTKFGKFLVDLNIKSGNDLYIDIKSLYYFYDVWTYENKYQTTNFNKFKKLVNVHLEDPVFLTTSPSYGIDRTFYEKVSKEDIKKAKAWAKKFKPPKQN